jgi:hypothetical protein
VLALVAGSPISLFNRYAYLAEKTAALDALAAMIERIINPSSAGNVVPLRG